MSCKRTIACLLSAAFVAVSISGCGTSAPVESSDVDLPVIDGLDTQGVFEDVVPDGDITALTLSEDSDAQRITQAGSYSLTGTVTKGQIVVNAANTDTVHILLNGAHITCDSTAAIYVKQAKAVIITLADGTENTLTGKGASVTDGSTNVDGAIFSKCPLTIRGNGTLTVNADGNGIVCKDALTVTAGTLTVTAKEHAIQGKEGVRIADGKLTLTGGGDGIHAENTDDAAKGTVYIGGGEYTIRTDGDGISASGIVQIDGGTGSLVCGGGHQNAEAHFEQFSPFGNRYQTDTEAATTISAKGCKAGGNLLMNGGTWNIDTADDALHSDSNAAVSGGTLTLTSGDDGVHANADLVISGGTLTVTDSYEGLEGNTVTVAGGTISVRASDDGINSAGGQDESGFGEHGMDQFHSDDSCYVRISGGKLTIDADGDGIDSNGAFEVSGGETYVSGPTNSGNGTLDYGGSATVSGGIFVAVGSSGMAQGFSAADGQGAMLVNLNGSASDPLTLKDKSGKVLLSYSPSKTYSSIIVTCPSIQKGQSYTLSVGDASTTITMSDTLYSNGGGMGGAGGMGGGMGGPGSMGGHGGGRPPQW